MDPSQSSPQQPHERGSPAQSSGPNFQSTASGTGTAKLIIEKERLTKLLQSHDLTPILIEGVFTDQSRRDLSSALRTVWMPTLAMDRTEAQPRLVPAIAIRQDSRFELVTAVAERPFRLATALTALQMAGRLPYMDGDIAHNLFAGYFENNSPGERSEARTKLYIDFNSVWLTREEAAQLGDIQAVVTAVLMEPIALDLRDLHAAMRSGRLEESEYLCYELFSLLDGLPGAREVHHRRYKFRELSKSSWFATLRTWLKRSSPYRDATFHEEVARLSKGATEFSVKFASRFDSFINHSLQSWSHQLQPFVSEEIGEGLVGIVEQRLRSAQVNFHSVQRRSPDDAASLPAFTARTILRELYHCEEQLNSAMQTLLELKEHANHPVNQGSLNQTADGLIDELRNFLRVYNALRRRHLPGWFEEAPRNVTG